MAADAVQAPDNGASPVFDVLRSAAFYLAFYGGSIGFVLAACLFLALRSEGPFRAMVHGWARWHRWCVIHLLGITIKIEGVRPGAGTLVALKHEAFFEAIDLPALLNLPVIFAKAELLRIPLWGLVAARYGLISVERDAGARTLRTMLAEARRLTAEGRPLAIFPEGTRVPHGRHGALQSGFAGLYKLLNLPVVPVAVNSGPLYHRLIKRRGTIRIIFGEPIPAGLGREEIEARIEAAINLLNT
jgi:1-acyl-sn-glycerol-3-phosphate acyltransferase